MEKDIVLSILFCLALQAVDSDFDEKTGLYSWSFNMKEWLKPAVMYRRILPADADPAASTTCQGPQNYYLFGDCQAEGGFPAHTVTCQCDNCNLSFNITCHTDGMWYPRATIPCDNPTTRCGSCKSPIKRRLLRCPGGKSGYQGEVRRCACRFECRPVNLKCARSGRWTLEKRGRLCLAHSSWGRGPLKQRASPDGRNFTFWCAPGHDLRGDHSLGCEEGRPSRPEPACVPLQL